MSELPNASTFFAADVHWQPVAGEASDSGGPFGRFLEQLADRCRAGQPTALYVIGDLFDFWFERGGRSFPFYEPYLALLRRVVDQGLRVILLSGNRDFTYGPMLPGQCGLELGGDRQELSLEGRRLLLHHGDLFCTRDWRYQLYRRVIRSLPARWLLALVPMRMVERLIRRMRRASVAEIKRKKARAMGLVDAAIAAEHERGFDTVICGHVHRAELRRVEGAKANTSLVVLGSWDARHGWYAAFTEGAIRLYEFCPDQTKPEE